MHESVKSKHGSVISAREAVLKALLAFRRNDAWPDIALGGFIEKYDISALDAALATRILNGVMQNLLLCDHYISHFSSIEIKKIEPRVLDILRISVYQIVFMDKIPHSAAVNEGVKLAKKSANPRAAGFVNAVLRKVSQAAESGALPDVSGGLVERLSIRYSHPQWLVKELIAILGEDDCEAFLASDNDADLPVVVQVNTLLTDTDKALAELDADGVGAVRHKWLDNCIEMRGSRGITRLDAFKNGSVYVQDAASRLAVYAADPRSGDFVIDGCAAPGGKSFASAIAMGNSGRIIACDIHESKLLRLIEGAKRLGITIIDSICKDMAELTPAMYVTPRIHITPSQNVTDSSEEFSDANENNPAASSSSSKKCRIDEYIGKADIVFADVPCSGFGAIRKKPEIRYKSGPDISGLPDIQQKILMTLSAYVKPGGTLLYSTCTILKCENEDIINEFLRNNEEYTTEGFSLPGIGSVQSGMITLWPHIHGTDGFFICKLRRRAARV